MLVFRILCAILIAWAVNWALSRPEAEDLLRELPEMETLGPIAGGIVGYLNLAVRQGWGFVVAFANGVWAGVLAILLSGVFYMIAAIIKAIQTQVLKDFDDFLTIFSQNVDPLIDQLINPPLVLVSLGATALIGVVTEVIHWLLVRVRQRKNKPGDSANS
jgi:hypothetical protein